MGSPAEGREKQAREVHRRLREEYPASITWRPYDNTWQLLVATILSAQCTGERVTQVTSELFPKYQDIDDYADLEVDELAEMISSITYPYQKAEWIIAAAEKLTTDFNGQIPETMAGLTELPGVGRKTANVVLQKGYGVIDGVAVDTHVMRLARRLGLTNDQSREGVERDLMTVFPDADWEDISHFLINHGQATCTARNPSCSECALEDLCPSSRLDQPVDLASGERWDT